MFNRSTKEKKEKMRSEGILNTIFNEDCLITMSRIESGTVDLILQDPPYGTTGNEWDIIPDFEVMWKEWERILKPDGMVVMTASQPFTSKLILSNEKMFKYCWVWNKKLAGNGILAKKQPLKIHEDVVVFGKGTCRYYPIKRKGVYRAKGGITDKYGTFNGAGSEIVFNDEYYPESIIDFSGAGMRSDRIHPTEKPIDLMRYMIQTYTQEGEIVFDGYMGSGTTDHACIIEKRNYIGSEMNEQFYKLLNKRLEREYSQPKLF
jgi:site-specific DNA-methyltransferase (adenine-specific)